MIAPSKCFGGAGTCGADVAQEVPVLNTTCIYLCAEGDYVMIVIQEASNT
jgi:hypothetical protein